MTKKRYAIVRVDNSCPSGHDGCKVNLVCVQDRNNIKEKRCEKCLYGDTKEQMIRKIMTAFKIAIKEKREGKMPKENVNRWVAEIVVEFLGVEE